ncbi:MAG: hypothetical protein AAGI44_06615 [Pseudomonadota bacterium]
MITKHLVTGLALPILNCTAVLANNQYTWACQDTSECTGPLHIDAKPPVNVMLTCQNLVEYYLPDAIEVKAETIDTSCNHSTTYTEGVYKYQTCKGKETKFKVHIKMSCNGGPVNTQ